MMVSISNLDLFQLTLILTTGMVMIVVIGIAIFSRLVKSSSEGNEMYIGGEGEDILSLKVPSSEALYWGLVRRVLGNTYRIIRDVLHSGILNEWYVYMSLSFIVLLALALAYIAMVR